MTENQPASGGYSPRKLIDADEFRAVLSAHPLVTTGGSIIRKTAASIIEGIICALDREPAVECAACVHDCSGKRLTNVCLDCFGSSNFERGPE